MLKNYISWYLICHRSHPSLAYVEFNDKDSALSYAETTANTIKNNNGIITQNVDINIMDYREVSTLGNAYNLIIAKDNMVILGATTTEKKAELDNIMDELNVRGHI